MEEAAEPGRHKKGRGSDPVLKQKSPAEFFSENKNIAGFDNPGKILYTTVRELLENALDSAEAIGQLPHVEVTIEEISRSSFNSMIGLVELERVDAELYDDFENERAKEKRLAKEAKEHERLAKAVAAGRLLKSKEAAGKAGRGRGETTLFRVTCKDNGKGMPHDDIANMLGRVLSGTKYGLRQTRGKFGLGAKMALIWSKMSTGLPIQIWSSMQAQPYVSYCRLDIDIHKNVPRVLALEKHTNTHKWRGAELQVIIEGNWTTYRSKIISYMRQMAVITPYAQLTFSYVGSTPDKNLKIRFARRTDVMPALPLETKYHPSAVDLLLIKRLIAESSKPSLGPFLQASFDSISKQLAERLVSELGLPEFTTKTIIKSLTDQQIVRIHQLFQQAKFDNPTGECLSPAGEYNLRLGIMKELHPEMVATYQSSVHVFEGHPFIVEGGISLGGRDVKPGINVFRFANRIPLLFEAGGDVVTRTAMKRINWNSYKINPMLDKIGVFVSIVSTKIPFKGTGKEYIGDDITQIALAVKATLQQCCAQLRGRIARQQQDRERQQRKRNLQRYIPDVTRAIFEVLLAINEREGSRKRPLTDPLLEQVAKRQVTEGTLWERLAQHVEQVDTDLALEYATQSGLVETAREAISLPAANLGARCVELRSSACVVQLLSHVIV
eukprot:SM000019S05099  [mRNA]  locus=s19:960297:966539:- [translate_table: standard]